jgi:hypothetical protein
MISALAKTLYINKRTSSPFTSSACPRSRVLRGSSKLAELTRMLVAWSEPREGDEDQPGRGRGSFVDDLLLAVVEEVGGRDCCRRSGRRGRTG